MATQRKWAWLTWILMALLFFQNSWYIYLCIPRDAFFSYNNKFWNGDTRLVNGNCGLEKPIHNILTLIVSLRKIVNEEIKI